MKTEQFDKCVERRLNLSKLTLIEKAKEYAKNENRMHNFDKAARITGKCREEALFGFFLKHLVSVMDIIDNINTDNTIPSQTLTDEKIGDCINYLLLLEASIQDKRDKAQPF